MGMWRREKGDLTGAMADFDTAIHHDAGFAAAWSNRGLCHLDRYEDMQAAVDFTRALELGGEQAVTLFHRAAAYARLKRHAEAAADLPRAAAYAPVEPSILNRRGIAREAQGQLTECSEDRRRGDSVFRTWY